MSKYYLYTKFTGTAIELGVCDSLFLMRNNKGELNDPFNPILDDNSFRSNKKTTSFDDGRDRVYNSKESGSIKNNWTDYPGKFQIFSCLSLSCLKI